jgi:ferredoxin
MRCVCPLYLYLGRFVFLTFRSRGSLVEYTHRVSLDDPHEVEMVTACTSCRIAIVRKREALPESRSLSLMTSVWVFSEDNTIRMQLKMEDGEVYLPYSSYFNPEKISLTVPCELRFHGVQWGERVEKSVKTDWVNYVFEDVKGMSYRFPYSKMESFI